MSISARNEALLSPMLQAFVTEQLPVEQRRITESVYLLAYLVNEMLPDSDRKTEGIEKLVDALDCFLKAAEQPGA